MKTQTLLAIACLIFAGACKSAQQKAADARKHTPGMLRALTSHHRDKFEDAMEALEAGADPNAMSDGIPALILAYENFDMVKALVKAGADPNAQIARNSRWESNAGYTILHQGLHYRFPREQIEWLLKRGANPNIKNENGENALLLALLEKREELVPTLHQAGAQDDILTAAMAGDVPTLKKLIEAKADVNERGPRGNTALIYAAQRGHVKAAELLIASGADINAQTVAGWTALCAVAHYGSQNAGGILATLIQAGANLNLAGCGAAMLRVAAAKDDIDVVLLLIGARVDVNGRDAHDQTALWVAKSDEMIQTLRRAGGKCYGRYSCPPGQRFETVTVTAADLLYLRDQPNQKGNKIAAMRKGAKVRVMSREAQSPPESVDGASGYWLEVQYGGRSGYAFSGFLEDPTIYPSKETAIRAAMRQLPLSRRR